MRFIVNANILFVLFFFIFKLSNVRGEALNVHQVQKKEDCMKNLCFFFLFIFAINTSNAQNWTILNSGTSLNLNSVYFPDPNTGYVAGENATILKTLNAGLNWTTGNTGFGADLFSVYFLDADKGWVCSEWGYVLRTNDGGASFWDTQVLSMYVARLNSVFFTSADTGYVVGGDYPGGSGIIEKTMDGGLSFPDPNMTSVPSVVLWGVHFPAVAAGYVVGDSGTILKTTDEGANWVLQPSGTTADLFSVYFSNANTGYAVGDNGTILKTNDGGTNWTSQNSGTSTRLTSVHFPVPDTGYAAGLAGTILKTTNGGTTWTAEFSGVSDDLNSIYFTDVNTGYAAGNGGLILKTENGGGVGLTGDPPSLGRIDICPNPVKNTFLLFAPAFTGKTGFVISDINGRKIKEGLISENKTEIDIRELASGVYFLKLKSEKNSGAVKILKQ
jgi:photosystem II stability/assembly factor-like uncharacterized protein